MIEKITAARLPGSEGEHEAQRVYGTERKALAFYNKQMLDYLNPLMQKFLLQQDMAFIATADAGGECDCSFRAGLRGFLRVVDERNVLFPEYRGNGVMASIGNIQENPNIGMIFVDFQRMLGLHINGSAKVIDKDNLLQQLLVSEEVTLNTPIERRKPERWVLVEVREAYIHCSKHIPLMEKVERSIDWGTDDEYKKGGDAFKAKGCFRSWYSGAT